MSQQGDFYGGDENGGPNLASVVMKELANVAEKFKEDDDEEYGPSSSPFVHLEKAAVLQDARIFHDSIAVRENPRNCCTVIGQLLHLQNTGQHLVEAEATEVFFGVTKLFMSDDASLRRMVYLFIKEVADTCNPDDIIIVTSSLTKDMTCDVDLYRANALRVLVRIVDSAMLGAIERYVKQAVVDSSAQVSSAALISSIQLFHKSPENAAIVKRWISEVQEATSSPSHMVQFHAMQLLYLIKAHDRLGVSKLVQQFSSRRSLTSPLALVLLARYTSKLIHDEIHEGRSPLGSISTASAFVQSGYAFLESSLRHKSEMVVYEAARAICLLPGIEPQDLNPAISTLQLFLSSPKPTVRFATLKVLANVSITYPRLVAKCNDELEALMTDANRSLATLAITTLLKTGSEASIDRLLKQISSFFGEIADEYKITIVKCIQELCFTYPQKHRVLVGFMSNFLREEGGFDFKKSIVNSIITLLRAVPETIDSSLFHLCEFIEDCEFTALNTQILHLLGELGPTTPAPARYIRFVYNRVILENAAVRAASVSALAKFGASCPSLRQSILVLLKRSLMDEDDETRDRAAIAVAVLEEAMENFPFVESSEEEEIARDVPSDDDTAAYCLLSSKMPMSLSKLEISLQAYANTPGAMESKETLQFSILPIVEESESLPSSTRVEEKEQEFSLGKPKPPVDPAASIYSIPELASLGRVFRSSTLVELSESETEYVVTCIKHIMEEYVVLQFQVQNTIEDQRLSNVTVALESIDDADQLYEITGEIPAESIKYGETASCYTVLQRNVDVSLQTSTWNSLLNFSLVQVDPTTGEDESEPFEEEYPLEDFEITTSDYMAKVTVPDFRNDWETMGNDNEVLEKFALSYKKMEDALAAVVKFLGMQTCDGTGTVKAGKAHMLHMSGVFVGGKTVLVRAQIAIQGDSTGCILKMAVRSDDETLSRIVADCIR
eukprot:CAMPEP_0197826538 /NCGR_PEP_ID=MMETSP1437-20131217/3478_1 /TAXON_ID=49252 ORGANISM="Eucampia antarctica, Strain CCMP1452" /NCGR_SAMPLE_ID=MMETSP1437 /ASSEMBLY_ACC=CAM_ASM_001096 /LENGTH=953 /DNA_ID=CAMNT_0043427015 /DNA_START=155 /DNA_END=3016 /DNA_ORIENTATION=-